MWHLTICFGINTHVRDAWSTYYAAMISVQEWMQIQGVTSVTMEYTP